MSKTTTLLKKGYKFRIYPTETQKELLAKTFGCCRYLWNTVLAETQEEYQAYIQTKENNTLETILRPNVSCKALSLRVREQMEDVNVNNPSLKEGACVGSQTTEAS